MRGHCASTKGLLRHKRNLQLCQKADIPRCRSRQKLVEPVRVSAQGSLPQFFSSFIRSNHGQSSELAASKTASNRTRGITSRK